MAYAGTLIFSAFPGHSSATVCHLGNIARALGRHRHWDPVQEVFQR